MADTDLTIIDKAGALASEQRPSFLKKGDTTGTDNISAEDLRLPRLLIAQGLSTQMIPEDSSYIKGLALFDLFHELTGEIFGRGPIKFIPIRRDVRNIEFDPENRGVPLDLEVPPGDPRLKWTRDETGAKVPPAATRFVEFVVIMLLPGRMPEPIVLSFKETNKFIRRAAERLTGFIKMRNPPAPIYAGIYTVQSKTEKNDEGTFGVYVVSNAGYVQDEGLYRYAEAFYQSLEGKTIVVQREGATEDDTFDPEELERQSRAGAGAATTEM